MMIRVKVKSKSELVKNEEGKSALYAVICLVTTGYCREL